MQTHQIKSFLSTHKYMLCYMINYFVMILYYILIRKNIQKYMKKEKIEPWIVYLQSPQKCIEL